MENRIPKNRYNGSGINAKSVKAERNPDDTLKKIEAQMDKRAADIAITISDMFKFMAMSAAMLPNMELDAGLFRLKVDDDGIFFEIKHSFRKRKERNIYEDCDGCEGCGEEPDDFGEKVDYDDDEEGLLYDGD